MPAYPAGCAEPGPASLLRAADSLLQQLGTQMDTVPGIRQQAESELQQKREQLLAAKNHVEVRSLSVQPRKSRQHQPCYGHALTAHAVPVLHWMHRLTRPQVVQPGRCPCACQGLAGACCSFNPARPPHRMYHLGAQSLFYALCRPSRGTSRGCTDSKRQHRSRSGS